MEFRTIVDVPKPDFEIGVGEEILFVGSCFADSIGKRFQEEMFHATVNPFGVMYNPASILHTIEKWQGKCQTAFFTLGTNHVYRLKETGEIVDNCQKRPASLFTEEELTVDECADYLQQAIKILRDKNPEVRVVLTVSPIRYRKYGYHGSQLSKATLLLAVDKIISKSQNIEDSKDKGCKEANRPNGTACLTNHSPSPGGRETGGEAFYFPSYEIVLDELRDYRFYKADMLHPSDQAVDYIWERMAATFFTQETFDFLKAWKPIREALDHRPFDASSPAYQAFLAQTQKKAEALRQRYPMLQLPF